MSRPLSGAGGRQDGHVRRLPWQAWGSADGNAAVAGVDLQSTRPMWSTGMNRPSMPPPRWQRVLFGLAPMMVLAVLVLTAAAVEITASESIVLDILMLAICLAAMIPAGIMAKATVTAERPATAAMRARYQTLLGLLTDTPCTTTPLINYRAGVVIVGFNASTRRNRAFLRLAMPDDTTTTPDDDGYQIYELFTLHHNRPVVLHKCDVWVDPDGQHHHTLKPPPQPSQRAEAGTWQMLTRTGIDVAAISDLDELIEQIRSADTLLDIDRH